MKLLNFERKGAKHRFRPTKNVAKQKGGGEVRLLQENSGGGPTTGCPPRTLRTEDFTKKKKTTKIQPSGDRDRWTFQPELSSFFEYMEWNISLTRT